jgi:hypothetical protein
MLGCLSSCSIQVVHVVPHSLPNKNISRNENKPNIFACIAQGFLFHSPIFDLLKNKISVTNALAYFAIDVEIDKEKSFYNIAASSAKARTMTFTTALKSPTYSPS